MSNVCFGVFEPRLMSDPWGDDDGLDAPSDGDIIRESIHIVAG